MRFVIITGLSGAGRSTALKTLEDMGFYCADNIPPKLIPEFAKISLSGSVASRDVAVVADTRLGDMFDDIYPVIGQLRQMPIELEIVFLDAEDEEIINRFKQTRRMHPLSGSGKIISGIHAERDKLQRIKEMANIVLDTTMLSGRMLSDEIEKHFMEDHDDRLLISVITFGYKRGIPMDADMVFDMRFLPNPFYIEELRNQTGMDREIREYLESFPETGYFLRTVADMVEVLVPCYLKQDKNQLVVAIGCTGGMHRSVAMGEKLYKKLTEMGMRVTLEHRDLKLEEESVSKRFMDKEK